MIKVANKRRKIEAIKKENPQSVIIDVTSSSKDPEYLKLSPFYPHGNIAIPGDSRGMTATCVEAIWQGLKVFEHYGIDVDMFRNDSMRNLKRTVRKYGKPLGHQYGVYSTVLLNYLDARRLIYFPTYYYVLDRIKDVHDVVMQIRQLSKSFKVILLDYNVNPDPLDLSKPISHAELIKAYIEDNYPLGEVPRL